MLVYGKNVAERILKDENLVKKIKSIYTDEVFLRKNGYLFSENLKSKVKIKQNRELDNLAKGVHQGIILDMEDYQYTSLNEVLKRDDASVIILDHILDPHNFGAIIRTCEAAGVDAIIIPKDRQVQVNATVMKTSVGTLNQMKIVQVANLASTIDYLKEQDFWVVGTALEDSVDYRSIDYSGKIVLIVGNEGTGISKLVRKKCDFVAKIPMYGTTNSLNASVASGIMIYEVIRNRK